LLEFSFNDFYLKDELQAFDLLLSYFD